MPAQPSGFRVKVWRKLQEIGAIAVKNGVYLLPLTPASLEHFQWLRQEIQDAKGEAAIFAADAVGSTESQEIVRAFREARDADYLAILEDLDTLEKVLADDEERSSSDELTRLRQQLDRVVSIDFFEAPRRSETLAACRRCEALVRAPIPTAEPIAACRTSTYRNRRWVTRKRPHIDRLASAWLIRRYIDSEARFAFVDEGARLRKDDVPFDMFGVDFDHRGDDCTFETLRKAFGLEEPALEAIARVVHDADLKDGKFGRRDAEGIERAVRALGTRLADRKALEVCLHLFDGLFEIVRQEELP
jgi:hypothetical protein